MRKFIARMANLIRDVAVFLVPVLTAIKLLIELANKVVNCNAHELQIQVSHKR